MNYINLLDKARYIPVLNLVTLLWFAVDSMRHHGWIKRAIKMFLTVVGCTLLSGIICAIFSWLPEWALGICIFCCLYGTVIVTITSVREEILTLREM